MILNRKLNRLGLTIKDEYLYDRNAKTRTPIYLLNTEDNIREMDFKALSPRAGLQSKPIRSIALESKSDKQWIIRNLARYANFLLSKDDVQETGIDGIYEITHDFENITSADYNLILSWIETTLQDMNQQNAFMVRLIGDAQGREKEYEIAKEFNIRRIDDRAETYVDIERYSNGFIHSEEVEYAIKVNQVKLIVIRENAGGCQDASPHKDKTLIVNGCKCINYRARSNNCFFSCVKQELDIKICNRDTCNAIRRKYKIPDDAPITISDAIKIVACQIFSEEDETWYGLRDSSIYLHLEKGHYMRYTEKPTFESCHSCHRCGRSQHEGKCHHAVYTYYQTQVKQSDRRYVYERKKTSKLLKVITYKYGGLLELEEIFRNYPDEKLLYLNCWGGSKHEYFGLITEAKEAGYSIDDFILSNGRVVKCKIHNVYLFDLSSFLPGTLEKNLQEYQCNNLDELFEKFNKTIHDEYGVNIVSYLTLSHLSYNLIMSKASVVLPLPTIHEEEAFRNSIYGARIEILHRSYKSIQMNDYLSGKLQYDDIDEYLVYTDCTSLYPSAMCYDLPTGEIFETTERREEMGIYYIKFHPNKNAVQIGSLREPAVQIGSLREPAVPVLPRRTDTGIVWNNEDGEGWYSSVDIETAESYGYKIEVIRGYYWESKEPFLKNQIQKLFKKKQQSTKGTTQHAISKLFMNGLYGKLIQHQINEETCWINSNHEFWNFFRDHKASGLDIFADTGFLRGEPKNNENVCIKKPSYLGAFVLAYSRRIMLKYMNAVGGRYFYMNTDSLFINFDDVEELNLGERLGQMKDEMPGCKILKAQFNSPLNRKLWYIKPGCSELFVA